MTEPIALLLGFDHKVSALLADRLLALGARLHIEPDPDRYDPFSMCPDMTLIGPRLDAERRRSLVRCLKVQDPLMPVFVMPVTGAGAEDDTADRFEGVYRLAHPIGESTSEEVKGALAKKEKALAESELPVLIGKSKEMNAIRRKIGAVSEKDITVLITGETGTGKELVARALHHFSNRSKGPLVKISCGNLPDQLLESEVFGFQKGAFTDAHRNKPGRMELAHNGTLFLDEIGDLSLPLQVKFLQIFEDRAFSRLGAVDERPIDARVVAATNKELWAKVKDGTFRQDLFYRLNVVHIRTPSLRERKEDIPLLVEYFLHKYCALLKRKPLSIPGTIINVLMDYDWPGNVRELENLVRRAIVLPDWEFIRGQVQSQGALAVSGTRPRVSAPRFQNPVARYFERGTMSLRDITNDYVSQVERRSLRETLNNVLWNRRKAARILGVSYKTLCTRIKELGLEHTESH